MSLRQLPLRDFLAVYSGRVGFARSPWRFLAGMQRLRAWANRRGEVAR